MSDRVKDEAQQARIVPKTGPTGEEIHLPDLGLRIDPAHPFPGGTEARQVAWQNFAHFLPPKSAEAPRVVPAASAPSEVEPSDAATDDWSQRARRIQEQIKAQKINLDQREQELHVQIIDLHEEQEKHAHRVARDQTQIDARKVRLKEEETQLAERMISFESEIRKFDTERTAIARERDEFERRKRALREEILAELHVERSELAEAQDALKKEIELTSGLRNTLQQRLDLLNVDNERKLKGERETLWQSLTDEWQQRGTSFSRERDEWAKSCEAERTSLERERAMFEAAMQSANAEFVASREALMRELTELRDQHVSRLEAERLEWDQVRLREESLLLSRFESQQAEFLIERESLSREFDELRMAHAAELDAERKVIHSERAELTREIDATRSGQMAQLEAERAALIADLESRKQAFDAACTSRFAELEDQRADIVSERTKLEQEFEALRAEQTALLNAERDQILVDRAAVEAELDVQRQEQLAQIAAERADVVAEREDLLREFERIRSDQSAQFAIERAEMDVERAAVEEFRRNTEAEMARLDEALQIEIATTRSEFETELQRQRQQWEEFKSREEAELEAYRASSLEAQEQLRLEMIATRQEHDAALAAERLDWEQTRQQEAAELAAERAQWDQVREQEQAQWEAQQTTWLATRDSVLAASREALEVEFMAQREQQAARLQAEHAEFLETCQREEASLKERQAEFARESKLVENRLRFQQDHLDKSRAEFEHSQNEYRRERQLEQQRLEEVNVMIIRRMKQIDLYRASVDAREKSLDREQEVLARTRKAITSTADLDRLNFESEKHAWDQERQMQLAEVRRQQEAMNVRNENLESRRVRLDKLRAELEETHRATLEMRLAVEESWAQLTQAGSQDEARQRVEQSRQALAGYYAQMHESLAEQRREQVDAQTKFERQRAEFAEERQKLTGWISKRDEDLRMGEERLRIAANDAATNHTKWLSARDRWLLEKTEAEQLIRRLLTSLGENNRQQSSQSIGVAELGDMKFPIEDLSPGSLSY